MTTKYTPGPWRVTSAGFDEGTEVNEATYVVAADPHMELSLANARLIAAAPELVEALRRLLDARDKDVTTGRLQFSSDPEAANTARAILAKIDGEQA